MRMHASNMGSGIATQSCRASLPCIIAHEHTLFQGCPRSGLSLDTQGSPCDFPARAHSTLRSLFRTRLRVSLHIPVMTSPMPRWRHLGRDGPGHPAGVRRGPGPRRARAYRAPRPAPRRRRRVTARVLPRLFPSPGWPSGTQRSAQCRPAKKRSRRRRCGRLSYALRSLLLSSDFRDE